MTSELRNRHGLTLIEVVIATALMASVLVALSQLQFNAFRGATRGSFESKAILLCANALELSSVQLHQTGLLATSTTDEPKTVLVDDGLRVVVESFPTSERALFELRATAYSQSDSRSTQPIESLSKHIFVVPPPRVGKTAP